MDCTCSRLAVASKRFSQRHGNCNKHHIRAYFAVVIDGCSSFSVYPRWDAYCSGAVVPTTRTAWPWLYCRVLPSSSLISCRSYEMDVEWNCFDTDAFISEIKNYPCIWNYKSESYSPSCVLFCNIGCTQNFRNFPRLRVLLRNRRSNNASPS
jgi:hypothetical protein